MGKLAVQFRTVNHLTLTVCIGVPKGYHVCMRAHERAEYVKELAAAAGFDRCGVTSAEPIGRRDYLRLWLERGHAGSMEYLSRHVAERVDPSVLVPGAKSVIVVALLYHQRAPSFAGDGRQRGRIAMYAWGQDYHRVVRDKLGVMHDQMRRDFGNSFEVKVCVDTVPLLEREVAAAAGIGWIGKNTLVLNERLGSYFFLGAMVTTLELQPDPPAPDRCGTCTACLDACPTDAFVAPYQMDASRCISYLTIEHRSDVPLTLASQMGDWIFGCDVCQQVCPHNRHAPQTKEPRFAIRSPGPAPVLDDLSGWSIDDYRVNLRGSAVKRAKLDMLQRNVKIAQSNIGRHPQDRTKPIRRS